MPPFSICNTGITFIEIARARITYLAMICTKLISQQLVRPSPVVIGTPPNIHHAHRESVVPVDFAENKSTPKTERVPLVPPAFMSDSLIRQWGYFYSCRVRNRPCCLANSDTLAGDDDDCMKHSSNQVGTAVDKKEGPRTISPRCFCLSILFLFLLTSTHHRALSVRVGLTGPSTMYTLEW